jgi:hypothetical protein
MAEEDTKKSTKIEPLSIEITISKKTIEQIPIQPNCDKNINKMLWLTLLPLSSTKYKIVNWTTPTLLNLILGTASCCILYYPSYYPTQGEIWTIDIIIVWFTYNYMIYLYKRWPITRCPEEIEVSKSVNIISLIFYWLYLLYWLYFAIIQFSTHNEPNPLIQLGNTLMSTAWFIFFSSISLLYYFICVKLSQRSTQIRIWLKELKDRRPPIETFYEEYNKHYRAIRALGKYWNILIFIGTLLLTFHVPIDLISILYKHYYYDIFGLIIKLLSLLWYLWRICELNDNEAYLVSYLYKHRLYSFADLEAVEKYVQYRALGLDFYGIKINKPFLIKVSIITLNLIIPTIYGLLSNQILK